MSYNKDVAIKGFPPWTWAVRLNHITLALLLFLFTPYILYYSKLACYNPNLASEFYCSIFNMVLEPNSFLRCLQSSLPRRSSTAAPPPTRPVPSRICSQQPPKTSQWPHDSGNQAVSTFKSPHVNSSICGTPSGQ